jgi:hypothetical protein
MQFKPFVVACATALVLSSGIAALPSAAEAQGYGHGGHFGGRGFGGYGRGYYGRGYRCGPVRLAAGACGPYAYAPYGYGGYGGYRGYGRYGYGY